MVGAYQMTTFFTSDTHFSHAAIVGYCNRPFANVEEMDAEMVRRWNARVEPGDVVYHLGDFAFGPVENIDRFWTQLNGEIVLFLGNHDRSKGRMEKTFGTGNVLQHDYITVDHKHLWLSHKPNPDWETRDILIGPMGFADYHLHGHVHEKYARRGNQINVGVDVRNYAPATLEELLATPENT